jgi:Protein of unknown function (DUF2510)/Domain of unknown function (DUF4234)
VAGEVDAYGARITVRRPLGVVGLTVVTLGVYWVVWYYRVNRELGDFGRAYEDPELAASDPRRSLLALAPGALVVIPAIVSLSAFNTRCRRVARIGGTELPSGWLLAAMFIFVVYIPFVPGYMQACLNELWRRYPDITGEDPEPAGPATSRRARALARGQRFITWLAGPERAPNPPPEWVFRPYIGLVALAASTALALLTSQWIFVLVPQVLLSVQVYEDRQTLNLPHLWWTSAVGTLGPLAFLMYVQSRGETLANMGGAAPSAAGATPAAGAAASAAPAAWYPDPRGQAQWRWWDGGSWTDHVSG